MAETGAANINTRSGPKHKRCRGHIHSHPEQVTARSLPLPSAAGREASLQRSWLQQRVVQVIVAPKLGNGESMPDRAGVGAMLGKAHLGDQSHTPIRQYQIWAFAAINNRGRARGRVI